MFAAAAAAISVAGQGIALAEELKGGPEARKAYAPVCVTMPTARICHKIA
ncbi:putative photosystem II 5 kDa protein, chloroplastic [Iris pallida]|uniref:Photosystem II 5 kDa protein, chloroplastic n=1 Tax=Iris pallida TaxID=29817 RepID=A0AAX6HKS7_IRIPA|nr:putative photosystem II 5 kDa protein, chloroplastic [Iris pallida]